MKTRKNIIMIIAASALFALPSCSDFMDLKPTTEYLKEQVFEDAATTQSLINTIYDYVIDAAREHTTNGLTDDAYFTHNKGQIAVNEATCSASDLQWYGRGDCPFNWSQTYKGIYYANLVLENIDKVPEKAGFDLKQMKGETRFLRAYMYTNLVRGIGGVPIVDKTVSDYTKTEEMQIARSSIGDCLDFILKDLDEAIASLPTTAPLGRATKWAAVSLKARICLHIASPLYADRIINKLDVNQYHGDREALYRKALEAAKEVIDSKAFKLIDCNAPTVAEIADKYHKITTTNNNELIFTKQFASSKITNQVNKQHGPNGYHNWSGTTPTQDFVMHFEMEDGSLNNTLTKVGDHQVGNPYNGREPRFYACIGYDGTVWGRKRAADGYALDPTPLGNLQCGTYELNDGTDVTVNLPDGEKVKFKGIYGCDTRQGPIEDWNGSWTSYYEKKMIDTSIDAANYPQLCPYPYIRLAEMYLIAAEACTELNQLDEAAAFLDVLRARTGRPDTKATLNIRKKSFDQAAMREFLRHERRTELFMEDSRYYDIRRWMIGEECGNKTLCGMIVFARLKNGKTAKRPYIYNESTWDYHYYVRDLSFREKRKWDNKMYFAPIKRDEINRNTKLVQNPGQD